MIKFRTMFHDCNMARIAPIEVIRETAKQVVLAGRGERREAKRSSFQNYFDTWDEAHQFLLDESQNVIDKLRLKLQEANGRHGNIRGMTEAKCIADKEK